MDEEKRKRIGHYAKMGSIAIVGALLVLVSVLGFNYYKQQQAQEIIDECTPHGYKSDAFYCCFGCKAKGVDTFSYLESADICYCEQEVLWSG